MGIQIVNSKISAIVMALLALALAATGSVALHYKKQVAGLSRQNAEFIAHSAAPRPAPAPAVAPQLVTLVKTVLVETVSFSTNEDVAALRSEVARLETALRAREEQAAAFRRAFTNPPPGEAWTNRTNWLEQMKTNDPARYAEIMKAREESRQRLDRSFAEKAAFLLKRDKSKMNETEQQQYDQMVSILTQTWKLSEEVRNSNMPREDRWQTMQTIRDNMRTLEPMMATERDRSFFDVGKRLGYSDGQAESFVQYMNDLIDITSMDTLRRNMRGGGSIGGPPGVWHGPDSRGASPPAH